VEQVRLARQSNRVVRRWPSAQLAMGRLHARLYRLSGGRFLPRWFAGAPVLVLETIGRRSGHKRATPVLYMRDGEMYPQAEYYARFTDRELPLIALEPAGT
jgi:F420H(2)-dependent quinone reductase